MSRALSVLGVQEKLRGCAGECLVRWEKNWWMVDVDTRWSIATRNSVWLRRR